MALPFLSLSNLVKNKFVIKFAITLRAVEYYERFSWHFFFAHCFYRTFLSIAVPAVLLLVSGHKLTANSMVKLNELDAYLKDDVNGLTNVIYLIIIDICVDG